MAKVKHSIKKLGIVRDTGSKIIIENLNGSFANIAWLPYHPNTTDKEQQANAEHIVRCVNNFNAMLKTLEKCEKLIGVGFRDSPLHDKLIKTIAKAKS